MSSRSSRARPDTRHYSKFVLVTGASGDLGWEFIQQLLFETTPPHHLLTPQYGCEENDYTIVALCRVFDPKLWEPEIEKLREWNVKHEMKRKLMPFKVDFTQIFKVNAWGPTILVNYLAPLLEHAQSSLKPFQRHKDDQMVQIAFISDQWGNISRQPKHLDPSFTNYCASKAALNMYIRHLSLYYDSFNFVLINRGWIQPEMVAVIPELRSSLTPGDAAYGCLSTMDKNCSSLTSGGVMIGYDGEKVPF